MEAVAMRGMHVLATLAIVALVCAVVPLVAANRPAGGDQKFVVSATAGNLAEINFGKLAGKHASNADVRKFAQDMVDDHNKANKELNDLAFNKKWEVAANMDREHQAEYDRLSKLEGADFDREYIRWQLKDHEQTITLFEDEAKNGDDAQLKGWCNKTLPTLREHLKKARTLNDMFNKGK
jgi:putative membrane protein